MAIFNLGKSVILVLILSPRYSNTSLLSIWIKPEAMVSGKSSILQMIDFLCSPETMENRSIEFMTLGTDTIEPFKVNKTSSA
ncbi:hypothetical protein GDO81_001062 [Engystomops pustulosus]|uniref:Uncharacterized protein n=1 Tax=Engystomops pustulosus TaxID=76066 RepID=A0AAV7DDB7_ENGPU|nr:hypothetical protein GDO81_001062 [Engystomops pustulosus]